MSRYIVMAVVALVCVGITVLALASDSKGRP